MHGLCCYITASPGVPALEVMSNHKMAGLDPQKSPSPRLTQQPGTIHIGRRVKHREPILLLDLTGPRTNTRGGARMNDNMPDRTSAHSRTVAYRARKGGPVEPLRRKYGRDSPGATPQPLSLVSPIPSAVHEDLLHYTTLDTALVQPDSLICYLPCAHHPPGRKETGEIQELRVTLGVQLAGTGNMTLASPPLLITRVSPHTLGCVVSDRQVCLVFGSDGSTTANVILGPLPPADAGCSI